MQILFVSCEKKNKFFHNDEDADEHELQSFATSGNCSTTGEILIENQEYLSQDRQVVPRVLPEISSQV